MFLVGSVAGVHGRPPIWRLSLACIVVVGGALPVSRMPLMVCEEAAAICLHDSCVTLWVQRQPVQKVLAAAFALSVGKH